MRALNVTLVIGLLWCASVGAAPREKQIFLVIDDAGLALSEARPFLQIPVPMTIAVLPHQKETQAVCEAIARDPKKEIILHQPMEARDASKNPGLGSIQNDMRASDVSKILDQNLRSVAGAVGINNHMGSRVTENPELVSAVLRYCAGNELFFLDSKTAYNSVVPRIAPQLGMHVEERHMFLDVQQDQAAVRQAWGKAVGRAKEHGYVIVIGHIWCVESAAAIADSYETLLNQGYTFHRISELYE